MACFRIYYTVWGTFYDNYSSRTFIDKDYVCCEYVLLGSTGIGFDPVNKKERSC